MLVFLVLKHLLCVSDGKEHCFLQISPKQAVGSVWHFGTAFFTLRPNFWQYNMSAELLFKRLTLSLTVDLAEPTRQANSFLKKVP